jgi:uncharacterized protein
MAIIDKVRVIAKRIHDSSKGSHDWEHTVRVYELAVHIARKEKVGLLVVKLAALLHDISRKIEDKSGGKIDHALEGARQSVGILKSLKVSDDIIARVAHCIETHRFRGTKLPVLKEAKILFDADKLDSIGAVGIGRAFLFAGEVGAKLHNKRKDILKTKPYTEEDTAYREYMVKLRHVKEKIMTKEGKRLAIVRHAFMENFFARLDKETAGIE